MIYRLSQNASSHLCGSNLSYQWADLLRGIHIKFSKNSFKNSDSTDLQGKGKSGSFEDNALPFRTGKMESLGEFLKKERESRQIPLEDIAQESKVNIHYLSLLEGNQLNELPSTYAKGYLQAYCNYLGLDKKEVFSRYSHQISVRRSEKKGTEKKVPFTVNRILIGAFIASVFIAASIVCLSLYL